VALSNGERLAAATGFSDALSEYYLEIRQEFREHLESLLASEPADLAPLIRRGISGGKQLRPVLCRLVSDTLEGDADQAFECGAALELIHCGALIHDDWIDGDAFRRDAPALWQALGPRTAVLVADLMIATGSLHGAISEATSRSLARCIRHLSEGAIADFTDHAGFTEAVYLRRIRHKTAALFGTAAELGALVSPRAELAPVFYRFGETMGIIYQLVDDYVDLLNSIKGNSPVGDLAMGIPTLPVTRLGRHENCRAAVDHFLKGRGAKPLLNCTDEKMARDTFEELVNPWLERAQKDLQELPASPYRDLLAEAPEVFAQQLLEADVEEA